MKRILQALILLYKRTLSPYIRRECKYTPTCSMYEDDASAR